MFFMKIRTHTQLGRYLYYMLWPLIWFYAPLRIRVSVIVVQNNTVLVVKNWFGPNAWQLPGGGKKIGESVIEAGVRELREETGLVIDTGNCRQLTSSPITVPMHGTLYRMHYIVYAVSQKPSLVLSEEVIDYAWVSHTEITTPPGIIAQLS